MPSRLSSRFKTPTQTGKSTQNLAKVEIFFLPCIVNISGLGFSRSLLTLFNSWQHHVNNTLATQLDSVKRDTVRSTPDNTAAPVFILLDSNKNVFWTRTNTECVLKSLLERFASYKGYWGSRCCKPKLNPLNDLPQTKPIERFASYIGFRLLGFALPLP